LPCAGTVWPTLPDSWRRVLFSDRLNRRWQVGLTRDQEIDLVLAAVIGVIVGGRLGYVLFYGGSEYLRHPLSIFATWNGGMSFHGGLAGILLAGWIMARGLASLLAPR